MSRVLFSPATKKDLREIKAYIARDSEPRARNVVLRLQAQCRTLADSPGIGRRREDIAPNLRSFPEGNYLIFYRVIEDGIEVARILHGAQDIDAGYFVDDEDE